MLEKKIKEIAEELISEKSLTDDQLSVAEDASRRLDTDLSETLVQRGFVDEALLLKRLGKKVGLPVIQLKVYHPDPRALALMTREQVERWKMIPLFEVEDHLTVATADPLNLTLLDEVRATLGCDVDCALTSTSDLTAALHRFYGEGEHSADRVEVVRTDEDTSQTGHLEKEAHGTKVVEMINTLFEQASRDGASDIHLEPAKEGLKVRFRIDGVLEEFRTFPKNMERSAVTRMKVLGSMDVAERRKPQDGRVRLKILGKPMDIRIATFPTMYGEAAALRLLTPDQVMTLEQLGFSPADQKFFETMIHQPHGMILVTGPTGSGKSTTLYAALLRIDRHDQHVLSVEDPIEHEIEGVKQTQVNPKAGVTFASAIRSILRQDPDVIMVGEIRDQETADVSLRAAMTGHLVFSTLHTNTALSALPRLINLGVEPYLVSSVLVGVVAQRLVRRICPHCRTPTTAPADVAAKAFQGKGCRECRMTGFRGRVGLFELVHVHDDLRRLIEAKVSESELRAVLTPQQFHSMQDDGRAKIEAGITTVDEVMRVIHEDSSS